MRMITRISKSLLLFTAFATISFAAEPVASVIGNAPIDVGGIRTPAHTLVPIAVGDEVSTEAGPAVVQFRDGSKVVLQPESQLQIEGQPADPSVRMVRGSATYDLVPTSRLRVMNTKGETVNQILDGALPTAPIVNRGNSPLPAAVVYRSSASSRQEGMVLPDSAFITGRFVLDATSGAGVISSTQTTFVTPDGTVFHGTMVNGVFTVTSIDFQVTQPNGTKATVSTTTGPLIGTTITAPPSGSNGVATFTSPSGTVINPAQVRTDLQTSANTAITNSGQPSGTSADLSQRTVTGQFSSSAP